MNRSVIIHGTLLAVALTAAYFVWTREPVDNENEISILSLRGGLDKVVYASEDRTVEINRKKDESGTYYWVSSETIEDAPLPLKPPKPLPEEKKDKAPEQPAPKGEPKADTKSEPKADIKGTPKADTKGAPKADTKKEPDTKDTKQDKDTTAAAKQDLPKDEPAKPEKIRKVKEFLGNSTLEKLMETLSNLSAVRALGQLDADKLKAFGLTEGKTTLTLVRGSSPHIFIIGNTTFGNMDYYIKDKADGRVYVLRPRVLQDFRFAESRLMERNLLSLELSDVDRAVITLPSAKKTILQKNKQDPPNAYWVDASDPEKKKEFYRNWFDKIKRLRVMDYQSPKEKLDNVNDLFTLEVFRGDKSLGALTVKKQQTLIPKVAGSTEAGVEYYAKSTTSRVVVKISRPLGDELARDIPNLLKE